LPAADRTIEAAAVKTVPQTGSVTDAVQQILFLWTTNSAAASMLHVGRTT